MNFNESGYETVLISSYASYLKIMIMITRGVSCLDVLILVNLEYLGSNALNKHYFSVLLVPDEVYNESLLLILLFSIYNPFKYYLRYFT